MALNLMKNGVNYNIYQERFEILLKLYKDKEEKKSILWQVNEEEEDNNSKKFKTITISRVINCEDNVTSLWCKLFEDTPSMIESFSCSFPDCSRYDYSLNRPTVAVNYKILIEKGL